MAYNWKPKYAEVDPENPDTWASCDRCSRIWNLSKLQWQHDYRGSAQLQNTRLLVCVTCLDAVNPQFAPYILSPDPEPIANARPYPYELAETDWLTTQDDEIITTQDDVLLTPSLPNPATPAVAGENSIVEEAAVNLETEDGLTIVTEEGDGNPLSYEPNP